MTSGKLSLARQLAINTHWAPACGMRLFSDEPSQDNGAKEDPVRLFSAVPQDWFCDFDNEYTRGEPWTHLCVPDAHPWRACPIDASASRWIPDLDDPATQGCLLSILSSALEQLERKDGGGDVAGWWCAAESLVVSEEESLGEALATALLLAWDDLDAQAGDCCCAWRAQRKLDDVEGETAEEAQNQ
jgi:hypothetical protein